MTSVTADFFFGHWVGDDESTPAAARRADSTTTGSSAAKPTLSAEDAALAERLQRGESTALEAIFRAHAADLEHYAVRLIGGAESASDAVQDVFVWLWDTRADFAPKTSIRAYLFGAIRHRIIDLTRRAKVRDAYAGNAATSTGTFPSPAELLDQTELHNIIAGAVATLTPRVREVAELRWFGHLSYKEIALLLGVSERTVNTQLTAATRLVRTRLEAYWRDR